MNDRFKGLVLSQSDYKEADQLMQVLSKEYGIISLVARSSKKLSSRNHILPMCLYEFIIDYKEGKTIYTVHSQKLLASYFEDSDMEMMSFKSVLNEVALKNREIDSFDELCFVYEHLNRDNRYLLGSMFMAHILKNFGITPYVDGCTVCGGNKVVALSNYHGGFLCEKHLGGEEVLPVETLKKFRLMIKGGFKDYEVLKDFTYEYRDLALLIDFYLDNTDVRLKAYDFYKTIN